MVETYKIIADINELQSFIMNILPDLKENEGYYVCLFARNKYCKELTHIKSDKAQLKRFTTNKEKLIEKLQQLEVPIGSYKQKELIVPQEALGVYISINPRNYIKAAHRSLITLSTLIGKGAQGYNPHQHVMSDIQRSCSRKVYTDFDFDFDPTSHLLFDNIEGRILSYIKEYINIEAIIPIRTRGGIHLLVNHSKIDLKYKNTWYQGLNSHGPDQVGDLLLPIPGCYQGGLNFYPRFI